MKPAWILLGLLTRGWTVLGVEHYDREEALEAEYAYTSVGYPDLLATQIVGIEVPAGIEYTVEDCESGETFGPFADGQEARHQMDELQMSGKKAEMVSFYPPLETEHYQ